MKAVIPPSQQAPEAYQRRVLLLALCACAFSFTMGLAFLPLPGLHYDEILFLHPFLFNWSLFRARIEGTDFPVMVMSYVGALKTWLYWPLYTFLPASVWTVRLPVLLLGSWNVWLIYRLGRRLWEPRAGLLAAALVATDPTLLLSQLFDWGPVAIQIFLSLSAALAWLRWRDAGSKGALALCGLYCGLALWNKAIFVWLLMAVFIAALMVWPRAWLPRAWPGRWHGQGWAAAAGVSAFLLGAAPFLAYNLMEKATTVQQNARFESGFPAHKLPALAGSLDGHVIATSVGMFAVWEEACTDGAMQSLRPATPLPTNLQWLPFRTLTPLLLAGTALLLLWQWRQSETAPARFLLLVFLLHSALAIMSVNGGTGLHHYAPVLPAVFLAIGGAFSVATKLAAGRGGGTAAWPSMLLVGLAVAAPLYGALTLVAWQQRAAHCGSQQIWTQATEGLAAHVRAHPGQRFYATDWGIDPQVIYLAEKHGNVGFLGELNEQVAKEGPLHERVAAIFANPQTRLVSFPPGWEVISSHGERLAALLALHGYRKVEAGRITDPRGRLIYVLWRLEALA